MIGAEDLEGAGLPLSPLTTEAHRAARRRRARRNARASGLWRDRRQRAELRGRRPDDDDDDDEQDPEPEGDELRD